MATDLSVVLVLVLTCCFSRCFTESRKDLRTKENVIQLGRALPHPNTIDPSQVTELSWRPRSGYSCTKAFYLMKSVTTLYHWEMTRKRNLVATIQARLWDRLQI